MSFRTVLSARHSAVLRKLALVTLCAISMSLFLTASAEKPYPVPAAKDRTCFLFAYAKENSPEQDHVCYAVSKDGCHFFALNSGMPLIYERWCVKSQATLRLFSENLYRRVSDERQWPGE